MENTASAPDAFRVARWMVSLSLAPLLFATVCPQASAAPLDDEVERLLDFGGTGNAPCNALVPRASSTIPLPPGITGGLATICNRAGGVPNTSTSAGGSAGAAATRPEIVKRRIDEEAPGAPPVVRGIFANVGMGPSDREVTAFQDGYQGDTTSFSAGLDREFDEWVAGFSINYGKEDGDFLSARGNFETTSLGATAFASKPLGERTDVDFYVGLDSLENERVRTATYASTTTTTSTLAADFDGDKTVAGGQLTYSITKGNVTIRPRAALDWERTDLDGYRETEPVDSGLALVVLDDNRTSLITTLGIEATAAISTSFGVLVLGEHLDFKYELDDDQRNISTRFLDDNRPDAVFFTFQTDPPDETWFQFGVDAIFVYQNGFQFFLSYEQMSSHAFLDNSTFSAGIRKEL